MFRKHGGQVILWATPWNSRHAEKDPVAIAKRELKETWSNVYK
jgi:hypothetical protein